MAPHTSRHILYQSVTVFRDFPVRFVAVVIGISITKKSISSKISLRLRLQYNLLFMSMLWKNSPGEGRGKVDLTY